MKRFFISTILISLAGSFLLHALFNYNYQIILYHLLVIAIVHFAVFAGNVAISLISSSRMRQWLSTILNFVFFAGLILFYLTIIGSNLFWGKAISAGLLLTYLFTFDQFISILPVQKWIFYVGVVLLVLLILFFYFLVRPSWQQTHKQYGGFLKNKATRPKQLAGLGILVLGLLLCMRPLLTLKRNMHFAGEPVLEFLYGPMWDTQSQSFVYDKVRIQNGLKDKNCVNAVTSEPGRKDDRVVVVILADALRKDFLPSYGYARPSTPFLDSLQRAKSLARVDNFFTTSTTTLPGVAGLFSSKDWASFSYTGLNVMKFLKQKGFSTYAFLTGQHRSWYGLTDIYRQDCDFFYESTTSATTLNLDDLTTLEKFKATSIKPNSFVYIHLLSTHSIGKKNEAFRKFLPDKIGIGTSQHTALINNYDNGILQMDHVIKEVFAKLKTDGQLYKSSIYILADHGELFGEDGRWSHSGSIQQNLLTIPLLIYDQDLSWYTNTQAGTIKDVAPTIVNRLGYTLPSCWEGVSLHEPVHDFSIRVTSASECEFPEGILSRKDSIYQLNIFDDKNQLKKVVTTTGGSAPWNVVTPAN